MLSNVSEQIRECYAMAEECARKAAAQADTEIRQDFLNMQRRWLFLAHSYEFTERLEKFRGEQKFRRPPKKNK